MRTVLAGLCGRGMDWLKKIESGERELRSHELLGRLAQALQVSDVRAAVRGSLFARAVEEPPSVDVLAGRVAQAWTLWHSSRF